MMSLSDVIYGRQLSMSSIRGLWLLWLCLFVSLISPSLSVNVLCCPEGTIWQRTSNCSDGTQIRLSCPSIFLMDPQQSKHDNFTVIYEEDTAWLLPDIDYEKISLDRFCVAKSMQNGGEIALVCFDHELIDDGVSKIWKNMLICIVSIISAIFLIATLAIYVILPELRELQDKAMMAAVTTLAVSYTVLSIQHLRSNTDDDYIICVSLGFILYFAFMSAFFWMNIVAFNVWRCVWFKSKIKEQSLFYAYCVWGWGGPTCFLIAALTTHHMSGNHLRPGFGEYTCWFSGAKETWAYFYGPVAVLLILNMLYLGMTSWRLWHQYREYTGSKLRILRFKCLLYIKLVLVMGITWIFELLSFAIGSKMDEFWIPTDLLNGLQGFIIFLLLVATRKRVRKLLAKKRLCGITFPKSWAAYEDEECEAVLPEELELSQQG
ncbi:PREDICTED: G-protein coupled receptor Mth2-like [Acromyrmex echinatior]|uniref:G-protein coupled receptor Mth2 n=1 Tax=Acromyrmex echinatior TaxID=103372 RepID=F4WFE8_ACREC|nr:PREDICTED: G-protein coupled receptor Mth2-like [Acromyrmex echinatior]EGI67199.1 G-protein coupled receptor Mth2 [Acromyrmex echinatior]